MFSTKEYISLLIPSCSTGNCSWPSYKSWAISSQANNVTNLLKVSNCFSSDQSPLASIESASIESRTMLHEEVASTAVQERVASTTGKWCNYSLLISGGTLS